MSNRDERPWTVNAPPSRYNTARACITRDGVPAIRARNFLSRCVPYNRLVRLAVQFGAAQDGIHTLNISLIEGIIRAVPNANVILNSHNLTDAIYREAFPGWDLRGADEAIYLLLQLWSRGLDAYWSSTMFEE